MTFSLHVSPRVWRELEDAIEWYEEQGVGLGMELAVAVQKAFTEIVDTPQMWPAWQGGEQYRKRVLSRFPYAVFYWFDDAVVRIVAVAHMKRKPGYWLR